MSTQPIPLEKNTWTLVATGPTTTPLFVEKKNRGAATWLAIAAAVPTFTHDGHFLTDGNIKAVELESGENLYAFASSGQSNQPASLTITE